MESEREKLIIFCDKVATTCSTARVEIILKMHSRAMVDNFANLGQCARAAKLGRKSMRPSQFLSTNN